MTTRKMQDIGIKSPNPASETGSSPNSAVRRKNNSKTTARSRTPKDEFTSSESDSDSSGSVASAGTKMHVHGALSVPRIKQSGQFQKEVQEKMTQLLQGMTNSLRQGQAEMAHDYFSRAVKMARGGDRDILYRLLFEGTNNRIFNQAVTAGDFRSAAYMLKHYQIPASYYTGCALLKHRDEVQSEEYIRALAWGARVIETDHVKSKSADMIRSRIIDTEDVGYIDRVMGLDVVKEHFQFYAVNGWNLFKQLEPHLTKK